MKILIVIDSIGTGGAQKLKAELAQGLAELGYQVEMFIYNSDRALGIKSDQFFLKDLLAAKVKINIVEKKGSGFSFKVLKELRKLLRGNYHVVISSLHSPSIYTALAILGIKKTRFIVCEESSSNAPISFIRKYLFYFATLVADSVVPNSFHEGKLMKKLPGRSKKINPIWNGYDISSISFHTNKLDKGTAIHKLLIVGRVAHPKNGVNLLKALSLFLSRNGWLPEVNWVGRRDSDKRSLKMQDQMDLYLQNNPDLAKKWKWLGMVEDVYEYYQSSDALMHISIYEGLPNVICEAMLSGCFVIASDVCDHPLIIGNEERGLLCNPLSPESICQSIERLCSMESYKRTEVIKRARYFAESNFNRESAVMKYEALLNPDKR